MYNRVAKESRSNFKKWLEISGMTSKQFLRYRTVACFDVKGSFEDPYRVVSFGYVKEGGDFIAIGERLLYSIHDESGFLDTSLLLLYMANILDEENKKAPAFEQRDCYFYNIVKDFIRKEKILNNFVWEGL